MTLVVGLVLAASSPSSAGASVVIESPNSVFNKGSGSLKLPGYGLNYFKCNSLIVKGTVPSMPDATASISEFTPSSCAYYNSLGEKLATATVMITGLPSMKAFSTTGVEFGKLLGEATVKLGEANCKLSFEVNGNLSYSNGPTTNSLTGEPWMVGLSTWGSPIPPCPWSDGAGGLTLSFPDPEFEIKDVTFKAPTVSTNAASSITQTGATLNGEITPNGLTSEYHFEYGLKKEEYGTKVPVPDASITSGPWTAQAKSKAVSELLPGTTYHFRLVAKNKQGTSYGSDQTFTTWAVCDPLSKSRIKIADMNGDSKADIFRFTDPADEVGEGRVWISEGEKFANKEGGKKIGTGFGIAYQDRTGDWDGDGDDDIFQFTETGRVDGWLSKGTECQSLSQIGSEFAQPCETRISDMNGDSKDDVFRFNNEGNGYVWLSTGDPKKYKYDGLIGTGFGHSDEVRFGDMDGDGDIDIFQFTNEGNGYAWRNEKGLKYTYLGLFATGFGNAGQVRVGDKDGDGDDDLYQFTDEGKGYYWESKGGEYTYYGNFVIGFGPSRQVRIADINGDKKSDILWFRDEGNGYAWLGNGEKGFGFKSLEQIGSGFGVP